MKTILYLSGALVMAIAFFYALNSYIYTTKQESLPSPVLDDAMFDGTVTAVNLDEIAADGPARITLLTAAGASVSVAVPSMGMPQCAARDAIASPSVIAVGDRVYLRGKRDETGAIVPCEDESHYLRVTGVIKIPEAGLEFTYRKGPQGYVLTHGSSAMSTDPSFLRGYIFTHESDVVRDTSTASEGPPTITVRTYQNTQKQWPAQWAAAHPLESNSALAMGSTVEEVVGGARAVSYQADGLFASRVYVITHGNFVHIFTAAFIDEHSPQPADLEAMLDSVVFSPEKM